MNGDGSSDLFGRFHLLERIGAGGMGEVFRAEMRGPDGFSRIVVVKRMLPDLVAEPEAVTMFVDEARIAARLVHPNIVPVYDFGKVGSRYFLVMEYVTGCDVSKLLAYLADQKQQMPAGVAVAIMAAVLEGLAFAHDLRGTDGELLGLVHRDIAPSNVLLGTSGEIKLTDFGIAKTRERLEHTRAGVIKGKHHYMSPEQASGKSVDARSDLFSLGVVLYRLIVGSRPFRGSTAEEILSNIRAGNYPRPEPVNPEVGSRLGDVLVRALQTRPEDRFQTAGEFRQTLIAAAALDSVIPDAVTLRKMVIEATAAFAHPPDNAVTLKARHVAKPEVSDSQREKTIAMGPPPEMGATLEATAPPADSSVPATRSTNDSVVPAIRSRNDSAAPPTQSTKVSVVIQPRHVAVGVFALVVLLATTFFIAMRLRGASNTSCTLRVALRMYPPQQQWFEEHVFAPFAKAEGCKVEVVEFNSTEELSRILGNGEADLAKVDIEHAPVLVELGRLQRLSALGQRVDARKFEELRKALRPEALQLGRFHTTIGDDLYLIPRKLETGQLFYRKSLVKLAVDGMPKQQAALDARLRELLGHGLPDRFTLNPDPTKWTSWDLIAASWVWAHTPIGGRTEQRYALRAEKRVLMEAIAAGAPAEAPWDVSPAMVDLFFEYAVLRELDVLHPDTYRTIDYTKPREMLANRGLAAFIEVQIDVGILVGNDHTLPRQIDDGDDWDVAPLPRLCNLERADAVPLVPESFAEVWGWGWGVPRNSREPERAMRLIMDITSRERHAAELEAFPILRVRKDVSPKWSVSRRLNEVGDQQLGSGRARYVEWPKRAGEIEATEQKIERAFRDLVIERHYRGPSQPIDRAMIESRLHKFLDEP